jgi:hypothetical protein
METRRPQSALAIGKFLPNNRLYATASLAEVKETTHASAGRRRSSGYRIARLTCRSRSKQQIAAAAATFSDSTFPAMGICTS